MKISFFTILSFVSTISTWAKQALEDGQITAAEAFDLIQQLADQLNVPLAVGVPHQLKDKIETVAAAAEAAATVTAAIVLTDEVNPKFANLK